MRVVWLMVCLGVLNLVCPPAWAGGMEPTIRESEQKNTWVKQHFATVKDAPYSFVCGGKAGRDLLDEWRFKETEDQLDANRVQRTQTWTDPATGLEMKCISVTYQDFPTVEWTLYFKNTGKADTPILSDIHALDISLPRSTPAEFVMHRIKGDNCTPDSYQPLTETLAAGETKRIAPAGGRPTSVEFPGFNIEHSGGGVIIAVSWAGQWSANFVRDDASGLHITAGQELTHFTLHPGEAVRSPMMVMQFYEGDWLRAQNVWRRWMIRHNMPRPGGKPVRPICSTCSCGFFPGMRSSVENDKLFCDKFLAEGLTFDCWWTDAGWYICDPVWSQTGTWEPDPQRYPKGLAELSDYVHQRGMKHIVWFEPERVDPGTWLAKEHPEWLLSADPNCVPDDQPYAKYWWLLNLSDPECLKWLTNHFDKLITEQHVDIYRQDFNINPLWHWRIHEPKDRQGITENHHVTAYFAFWDELRKRHPGMLIDSCASGGRRNDLETLRRAVPLLRSDYQSDSIGNQCHTYGLSLWIPYSGTGEVPPDTLYRQHSILSASIAYGGDPRKDLNYALLHKTADDWRAVADCFLGDYYPLTPWTLDHDKWIAFQFDKLEAGKGMVQIFRREQNPQNSFLMKLSGLDPKAIYQLEDLSSDWKGEYSGQELMEKGISILLAQPASDALIVYRKL